VATRGPGRSTSRAGTSKVTVARAPVGPATKIGESGFAGATALRRVGSRLGIYTVRDLLFHLPRRYDDLRALSTARELAWVADGEPASARLQVRGIRVAPTFRRHVERTTVYLGDDTGEAEATWFGGASSPTAARGQWIVISGKIRRPRFKTSFDTRVPARRRLGSPARGPNRCPYTSSRRG